MRFVHVTCLCNAMFVDFSVDFIDNIHITELGLNIPLQFVNFVAMSYTVACPDGQCLTGQLWHKTNPIFATLPFVTLLVHEENDMAQGLEGALAVANKDGLPNQTLIVCNLSFSFHFHILFQPFQRIAEGLEKHHPFSDTPAVDIILKNAKLILNSPSDVAYARRIWGLMSNYVLFDRLCATFGVATVSPCQPV